LFSCQLKVSGEEKDYASPLYMVLSEIKNHSLASPMLWSLSEVGEILHLTHGLIAIWIAIIYSRQRFSYLQRTKIKVAAAI
jgi:hypothetical protein